MSAVKELHADLVITDINVVDVFSQDIFKADVAVSAGYFVGIGEYKGYGKKEINGSGKYIIPGFIDAHAHVESTLVTPVEYSNTSLPHGITGVVADPHEIANVCGVAGIEFILENSRQVPMDFYIMLPSCVPATSFEHGGYVLSARELKPLYLRNGVIGLAEVMDFPAVLRGDPDMLQKLEDADNAGYRIDGHAAGFGIDQLNAYAAAGIRTDHECDSSHGLVDRIRRGIYTLVREGTVCKDLLKMLPAINEKNSRLLCFATDDKHLDDLYVNGGVDFNVRVAIGEGLDPATAIQMASLNTAECYKLKNVGAIVPGYVADFSIVSDLKDLRMEQVYKDGQLVAENGRLLHEVTSDSFTLPDKLVTSVNIPKVSERDFDIPMGDCTKANIIGIEQGSVVSSHLVEEVDVAGGMFKINIDQDQLKIAVIERHKNLGNISTGIVKGFRLKSGAMATTIAHDSHNLIVVGTNEGDMALAVAKIQEMQGGIVVVNNGQVSCSIRLEIAGLITSRKTADVVTDLERLHSVISELAPGCSFNPFLALSFMSLIVIPHLKISDSGLFDFHSFSFIDVPVKE